MEQMRAGVCCHGSSTNGRADADMVFEDVFSNGHWWSVNLELLVDRDQGTKAQDQWLQPSDSISLHAVLLCGLEHDEMRDGLTWFVPSPWDPKAEVNPRTICDKLEPQMVRAYTLQSFDGQVVTLTTTGGETIHVTIEGNPLEATVYDICALANECTGFGFLSESKANTKALLGSDCLPGMSLVSEHMLSVNNQVRPQSQRSAFSCAQCEELQNERPPAVRRPINDAESDSR